VVTRANAPAFEPWSGNSVLSTAIQHNASLSLIKALIDAGADVNAKYSSPIAASIDRDRYDCLCFLIDAGADVANDGEALRSIAEEGDLKSLKRLLAAGVKLESCRDSLIARTCRRSYKTNRVDKTKRVDTFECLLMFIDAG